MLQIFAHEVSGFRPLLKILASIFVAFCFATHSLSATSASIFHPPLDPARPRSSYIAHAKQGMVVAAHPLASAAGEAMLKAGGFAVDAAVATSFALAVVRPQSTGIGGGGFLLYHQAIDKSTRAYDFRERAPTLATRDMFLDTRGHPTSFRYNGIDIPDSAVNGHLAVAVPGLVRGLVELHAKYGKLPLAQVLAPAIKIAESGFPVYPALAKLLLQRESVLKHFPGTFKIFFRRGKPLQTGELLIQKDLAWTLRQIAARGAAGFYDGAVANLIVAEMQRGKGLVTANDLASYTMREREPLTGVHRGHRIMSMPPPSSGGAVILEILNILETNNANQEQKLAYGSTGAVHWLTEAMRRAFADRSVFLGDPEFTKVPLKGLISKEYAASLRANINPLKATPSSDVKGGDPEKFEHPSTTHLSVVDSQGNAVSSTQTVNYYFGSGVVAEGTGVLLNDEMDDFAKKSGTPNVFGLVGSDANAIKAGKTPLSSMSPTLVFDHNGKLRLVLGSPGGPRIITATLQTIINVLDHQMSLADAVHAYRIHQQWLPDKMEMEPDGLAPNVVKELKTMGHNVVEHIGMGDVEAIEVTESGLIGVSDTRSDGKPMGF